MASLITVKTSIGRDDTISINIDTTIKGALATASTTTNQDASTSSVRVYTKANPNLSFTIRKGDVVLAPSNPSDLTQHWIKCTPYVKEKDGCTSFALLNKATYEVIKHSTGHDQAVQLVPYDLNKIDGSVLWSSLDLADSYSIIRTVKNEELILDAWNGDEHGVRDGTKVILFNRLTGLNQK